MRRFLFLALLAASLLPGPVRAQATADQLNKLSLEALTARPAGGGGGGYTPRTYHRSYAARRYPAHSGYRSYAARRFYAHGAGYRVRRYAARSYPSHARYHAPSRSYGRRSFSPMTHQRVATAYTRHRR